MFANFFQTIKWTNRHMKGFRLPLFFLTFILSVLSLSNVGIAFISKQLVDMATNGQKQTIYTLFYIYAVIVAVQIVLTIINEYFNVVVWQNISIKIRTALYKRLIGSEWIRFSQINTGEFVSRFTHDTSQVANIIVYYLPNVIASTLKLGAAFLVLFYYNPYLAIFAFIFGPIAFLISRIYSKKVKQTYKRLQELDAQVSGKLQENFYNIQIIKAFHLEEDTNQQLKHIYEERKNIVIKNTLLSNYMGAISSTGSWTGYFLAYATGILGIYNGEISYGILVVFLQLFSQIQEPLSGLASSIPQMAMYTTCVERLIEMENMNNRIPVENTWRPKTIDIELSDVQYTYPGKKAQFKKVNLTASNGEIVLLMGQSGSGKTTLIRLLLNFIKPDQGKIMLTDETGNIRLLDDDMKYIFSYVPQGNSLFSGTILDNVKKGNKEAKEEEVIIALESACAWDFVSQLPKRVDTIIGERGIGISEGQAQRIAIARALISKAPAVILDEATSGLDKETEQKIMHNIKKRYERKTFIVISHRETVKEFADKLYVMKDGELSEQSLDKTR